MKDAELFVSFAVPGTPPSVNQYVRHTRRGIHYVSKEAKAFKEAIWVAAAGRRVVKAKVYYLEAIIYLGKGQKLDGDNAWKCIADGLVQAKVIHSDAAVKRWILVLDRDWQNPRTVIYAWAELK